MESRSRRRCERYSVGYFYSISHFSSSHRPQLRSLLQMNPLPAISSKSRKARSTTRNVAPVPDAVVLIHDGIAHSAVWDAVWPAFCKEFHTVRYDRRGYGRSPAATTWYYETDDLFTLLRHLKINRAFLVGSSHGGELTIDFTLAHPKLVDGMVLVGAVVSGYGFSDHFLNRGNANNAPMEKNDASGSSLNRY